MVHAKFIGGPWDGMEMAIERGQLQDLVFDHQTLASHRAMAAILAVILKLQKI